MGNQSSIVPGDVQRMSAGTGVTHSGFNHEKRGLTHFLQIWFLSPQQGLTPSYEQKAYPEAEKRGRLRLVVSPDGRDGSVTIHQDACMFSGLFDGHEAASHDMAPGRLAYAHMVRAEATVSGRPLKAGDALLYKDESQVTVARGSKDEMLVFDLPDMDL